MEVIDTVPADSLEVGDTISLFNDEITVKEIVDCLDINDVSFRGFSATHDSVETYQVPADKMIDILGA